MSFPRYPEYKDSGEEWLGEVPGHWASTRYKNVFDEKNSIAGTSLPPGSISFGRVIFKNDEFLHEPTKASYQEVLSGEFLINPINLNYDLKSLRTALSEIDTCVSPAYIVLKTKAASDKSYLKYQLHLFDLFHMKTLGAGVRQTITFSDIRGCFTCLPSLPEQTQIAAFLDRETAKIDELVREQRRLMELLKEKRQAVISHAVTQGLNPHAPMKPSGIEWLGEVPGHWEVMSLRRCSLRVQTGGTPSSEPPSTDIEDGLVWYTPGDFGDSLRLTISDRKISRSVAESGEAKVFPPGSALIVSIGATLGKVGFAETASSGNQQINAVIPNNRIDGYFLTYSLLVKTEVMRFLSNASTIGIMNQEKTKEIWLAVPPRHEQDDITAYLDTESAKFDTLTAEAQRAIALLQERRTALISAAVTGQIDVRLFVEREAA